MDPRRAAHDRDSVAEDILATRIGKIRLRNGAPSQESVTRLRDELDFQRATQAYLWALPAVALDGLRIANHREWGVDFNMVGVSDVYAVAFVDLARDGAVVIESPAGVCGVINDYWQRPVVDVGPYGLDEGEGGKFLIVPPDYHGDLHDYLVAPSLTNRALYLVRGIASDVELAVDALADIRIYPASSVDDPPPTSILEAGNHAVESSAPEGLAYWKQLVDIIDHEPLEDRDRPFHAMLKPLGIERGRPFAPDARQTKILIDAAEVGALIAQSMKMT